MYYVLFSLVALFLYIRYFSPLLLCWRLTAPTAISPAREVGRASSFILYALYDIEIPSNQWRSVDTGITFFQPSFTLPYLSRWGYEFTLQGQMVLRAISPMYRWGVRAHQRLIVDSSLFAGDAGMAVMLYNDNQVRKQYIRRGDPIALLEVSRVPFTFLKRLKK